jgi:hypothetical protein
MSVVDTGRGGAELIALADGLGMLPSGARAAGPAELTRGFERLQQVAFPQLSRAQAELEYARVSGRGMEAARGRLREAGDRFTRDAEALVQATNAEPAAPDVHELRKRLLALAGVARDVGRPGWGNDAQARMNAAAQAARAHQAAADQHLYDSDAEVKRICDWLEGQSRFELVRDALSAPGTGLLARLGPGESPTTYAFADDLTPLRTLHSGSHVAPPGIGGDAPDAAAAAPAGGGGGGGGGELGTQPKGNGTDLAAAVATALARAQGGGHGVRAVVLFSDGRQTRKESVPVTALASAGVPVFAVAAAPEGPAKDLSFADISVRAPNDSAFVGETVTVRATVRASGVTLDPMTVRLRVDDGPEFTPVSVEAARDEGRPDRRPAGAPNAPNATVVRRTVRFAVPADQPGVHALHFSIPHADGEATYENNEAQRWLKVLPEKIRVAAYAGAAGWDFQYLRGALGREEFRDFVSLEAAVLDSPAGRLTVSPGRILRQDVVILYDMPAGALDLDQWAAVHQLVETRGGSVIFVAGPDMDPAAYAREPLAGALMPFPPQSPPAWRTWPGDRPSFRLLAGPALDRDTLRLGGGGRGAEEDDPGSRWAELPGLYRVLPVRQLKQNVRTLLIDSETHSAVLTEAPAGLGRSFFFGANETWRWRKTGAAVHERFWRSLVRHASDVPYAARAGSLGLDTDAVSVAPFVAVGVRARIFDPALEARADALRLEVLHEDNLVGTHSLVERVPGSGRFRATVDGLPEGEYEVRLTGPDAEGGEQRLQLPLHVAATYEPELRDVSPDYNRLHHLADVTGGQTLRIDQVGQIPERLAAAAADNRPAVNELPLWDSPWLFLFVVACLGVEWGLRKRFGLA